MMLLQRVNARLERQIERLKRKAARSAAGSITAPPNDGKSTAEEQPTPPPTDVDAKAIPTDGKQAKPQPAMTRKARKHALALQQAVEGHVMGRKAMKRERKRAEQAQAEEPPPQQQQQEEGGKRGRKRREEDEEEDDEDAWRRQVAAELLGLPGDASAAMIDAVYRVWREVFDTDEAADLTAELRQHYKQQAERMQAAYELLMNDKHDGDDDDEEQSDKALPAPAVTLDVD